MLLKMSARRIHKVTFALLSGGTLLTQDVQPQISLTLKHLRGLRFSFYALFFVIRWIGPISRLSRTCLLLRSQLRISSSSITHAS